jgi:hypothetical protein
VGPEADEKAAPRAMSSNTQKKANSMANWGDEDAEEEQATVKQTPVVWARRPRDAEWAHSLYSMATVPTRSIMAMRDKISCVSTFHDSIRPAWATIRARRERRTDSTLQVKSMAVFIGPGGGRGGWFIYDVAGNFKTTMETIAVLRVEDCSHVWGKQPDSPVLLRLGLESPLAREQLLHLSMAGPWLPVMTRCRLGAWRDKDACFAAEIVEIDVPPKPHYDCARGKPRKRFGKTMLP